MAFNLDNMADVLRSAGLNVVETPDWKTRGYAQQDLKACLGVLWHHTATNRLQFLTNVIPTLNMLVYGRSNLAGPLCNLGLARNGTVYVVATGVANHAGAGSLPGIPTNMGNHYMIGIEMESSGIAPWDWTPQQLAVAPRLGAALERAYMGGLPPERRIQAGHMEYSSEGKIDPAGWPGGMDGLRAQINAVLNGTINSSGTVKKDDWEMATPEDVAKAVFEKPFSRQGPGVSGLTNLGATVAWLDANLSGIVNRVVATDATIKALTGAIAAMSKGEPFDEAKLLASIEAKVAAGVKAGIESINTTTTVNVKK